MEPGLMEWVPERDEVRASADEVETAAEPMGRGADVFVRNAVQR
ncbi:hypothetical protein [Marispirochaeta sp.]|jgi:hypothetical protein|nr:hypothetical protein [Marispirochaeta sp.]